MFLRVYTSTCVLFYHLLLPQREEYITKECYFLSDPTRCFLFSWNHFINLDKILQINIIYNLNTTHTGLRVRGMGNKHGRKIRAQNTTAEDCKENTWTYERKERCRMRKKQGNKGHMTRGRYCKIYKIPTTNLVRPCRKNEKPATAKINCNIFNGGEK